MSKASKIIDRIEKRKRAARKPAPKQDEEFNDKFDGDFSVQIDTPWWLLSMRMIERYEYWALRQLQGAYLQAQIQPPKCFLGRGSGSSIGGGSAWGEYPTEKNFSAIRYLSRIQKRMGMKQYKTVEFVFLRYRADDDKLSDHYKDWLSKNIKPIAGAVHELAYAIGYTTETGYAREKREQETRLREILSGKPARLHPRGDRASNGRDRSTLLRAAPNFRFRNGAAA